VRFSIIWSDNAYQDLAEIYLAVGDAPTLDYAIKRIEKELQVDPDTKGRTTNDGDRLYRYDPLLVFYCFDLEAREVEILQVSYTR
jgi:plasmid stabilization system protein ParE